MEDSRIPVEQSVIDSDVFYRKSSRTAKSNATTVERSTKERSKGIKRSERGQRMMGRIERILYGQSHGFIRAEDNRRLFFHRSDVRFALFNALVVRDRVAFEVIEDKLTGPRAVRVKRAAKKSAR